jgi:hypothetical protein
MIGPRTQAASVTGRGKRLMDLRLELDQAVVLTLRALEA